MHMHIDVAFFRDEPVVMMVIIAVIVNMSGVVRMIVAMQEMCMAVAGELPHQKEKSHREQQPAGDPRKNLSRPAIQRHAEQRDQSAQQRGETGMPQCRQRCYRQGRGRPARTAANASESRYGKTPP